MQGEKLILSDLRLKTIQSLFDQLTCGQQHYPKEELGVDLKMKVPKASGEKSWRKIMKPNQQ